MVQLDHGAIGSSEWWLNQRASKSDAAGREKGRQADATGAFQRFRKVTNVPSHLPPLFARLHGVLTVLPTPSSKIPSYHSLINSGSPLATTPGESRAMRISAPILQNPERSNF
eukprot:8378489-Pyramimonas_sp.AAC.1